MHGSERLLKYLQVKNSKKKGMWRYWETENKYQRPLEATGVNNGETSLPPE